ncbi:MAG: glycosyltransferase 87 family protein [Acidimicrobiia bacterium]
MPVERGLRVRRHLPLLLAVGLVGLRIATVSIALTGTWLYGSQGVSSDAGRYHWIATARGTPYRDFQVEQPPVTLALIEAVNGSSRRATQTSLAWSQLALDLIVAAVLAWGWGRRAALAYLIIGLPFALYPFLYLRLDLLSVALAIGGLALVHRRRAVSGGALLAIASFAKLWPIVLVPSLVVTKKWRALTAFIVTFGAGLIAWIAWSGPDGLRQVLTYRGARGWQIESSIGVVVHAVSHARVHLERGAPRVGDVPTWAKLSLLALGAALVLAAWLLASRIRGDRRRVLDSVCPLAAISALMFTSTLLSPQYASWLLPFAAIGVVFGNRLLAVLTGAIAALSVIDILMLHELVTRDPVAIAVVIGRNVLLLVLYLVAVGTLWRLATTGAPRRTDRDAGSGARDVELHFGHA